MDKLYQLKITIENPIGDSIIKNLDMAIAEILEKYIENDCISDYIIIGSPASNEDRRIFGDNV